MMNYPTIYTNTAIQVGQVPTSDGLGTLSDMVSCQVTWDSEGKFEVDLEYPADGIHARELTGDRLLRVPLPRLHHTNNAWDQFFRIVTIEESFEEGSHVLRVHAEHLYYDLHWAWCVPVTIRDNSPAVFINAIRNSMDPSNGDAQPDKFIYSISTPADGHYHNMIMEEAFTKLEGLMWIANDFKGFLEPDNLALSIVSRGTARPYVFERGKNIITFLRTTDYSKGVDGVYTYYKKEQYHDPRLYETESLYGTPHYTAYNYAQEENDQKDVGVEALIGQAWLKNNTQKGPESTFTAKVADDGALRLRPWDSVTVEGERAEVRSIVYDALRDRFLSIEVGSRRQDITDTLVKLTGTIKAPTSGRAVG